MRGYIRPRINQKLTTVLFVRARAGRLIAASKARGELAAICFASNGPTHRPLARPLKGL